MEEISLLMLRMISLFSLQTLDVREDTPYYIEKSVKFINLQKILIF